MSGYTMDEIVQLVARTRAELLVGGCYACERLPLVAVRSVCQFRDPMRYPGRRWLGGKRQVVFLDISDCGRFVKLGPGAMRDVGGAPVRRGRIRWYQLAKIEVIKI